ncbi:MAG: GxxExxY protein [Gemmatimonadaceae bacterium]
MKAALPASDTDPHRDPITYRVIGALFGVYRELGWGFLKSVYRRALLVALADAGANAEAEVELPVTFRGRMVGNYRADLIVDDQVIVEVKAAENIAPAHRAQVIIYLKATTFERGMPLNFGPKPQFERLVLTNRLKLPRPLRL